MSCWTLWQRMPPRYQLTMRDVRPEDEPITPGRSSSPNQLSRTSSASPRSPRLRSPKGGQRLGSARARVSEDGAMLRSGAQSTEYSREADCGAHSPVLPARRSPYIHNMKNQMRLNSARRKMDESGMTSPVPKSYTPKPRANTAPPFPITKLSNHSDENFVTSPRHHQHHNHLHNQQIEDAGCQGQKRVKGQRGFSGMRSPKRPSSGYSLLDPRRVAVHTISPFGEITAEGSRPMFHPRSPRQQDCVIGDYQVAALYLDKGKVTFFRKTRPDVAQSVYSAMNPFLTTRDDGSYLAHLRKAYLSGVRDLPKVPSRQPDVEKHTTIKERMDYDRKVGRILDYYAKVDIPKEVHAPRPPNSQCGQNVSVPPQKAFRTMSSRRRAPKATEISSVSLQDVELPVDPAQFSPRLHQFHHHPQNFHMRDASGFVRINAQARLHDRRFYLRTPAGEIVGPGGPTQMAGMPDMSDCACGMCRLEMEVALMAQLQREMGVPMEALTSSLQGGTLQSARQPPLGVVSEEDTCPARPNSVSDPRKVDVSTETAANRAQNGQIGSEAKSGGEGHGEGKQDAESQRPNTEPTSLKVTLPGVEEVPEGAAVSSSTAETARSVTTATEISKDVEQAKSDQPTKQGETEKSEAEESKMNPSSDANSSVPNADAGKPTTEAETTLEESAKPSKDAGDSAGAGTDVPSAESGDDKPKPDAETPPQTDNKPLESADGEPIEQNNSPPDADKASENADKTEESSEPAENDTS